MRRARGLGGWPQAVLVLVAALAARALGQQACTHERPFDVVLVVDGSGSLSGDDFLRELGFVHSLISSWDIASGQGHVGIVQFSAAARLELELGGRPKQSALDAVCVGGNCVLCYVCGESLQYQSDLATFGDLACCSDDSSCCCYEEGACPFPQLLETTDLAAGLTMARNQLQANAHSNTQIVIVFSDYELTTDDNTASVSVSTQLQGEGVTVAVVGVGTADGSLDGIAPAAMTFHADSFSQLESTLLTAITDVACEAISFSLSASPSQTATSTRSHTNTPSPSPTAPPTPSPTTTASPTPSPTLSETSSVSATISLTPSPSPSPNSGDNNNNVALIAGVSGAAAVAALGAAYAALKAKSKFTKQSSNPPDVPPAQSPRAQDDNQLEVVINPMLAKMNVSAQERLAEREGELANIDPPQPNANADANALHNDAL